MLNDFLSNEMVLIPNGTETIRRFIDNRKWISSDYRMSIPSQGNNQTVRLEEIQITTFYLGKTPVTKGLYDFIIENKSEQNQLPVVDVSWLESIEFCNKLSMHFNIEPYYTIKSDREVLINRDTKGFRLATDAEWQYACKGGIKSFQYGNSDDISWHQGNAKHHLHHVGLKTPNQYGLYDMLGLVWEWCFDLYNKDTYDHYRIFRGGSYEEESRNCGATTRRKSLPTFSIDDLGFRIAKSI